jgi:hypothetical protein
MSTVTGQHCIVGGMEHPASSHQPEPLMDEMDTFIVNLLIGQTEEQYKFMRDNLDRIMIEHETHYACGLRPAL